MDGLPKPDQQSELLRQATGPLVHRDKRRKRGDYCKAKCALCYTAAVMYLSARVDESRAILDLKGGESLTLRGKLSEKLIQLIEETEADLTSVRR